MRQEIVSYLDRLGRTIDVGKMQHQTYFYCALIVAACDHEMKVLKLCCKFNLLFFG